MKLMEAHAENLLSKIINNSTNTKKGCLVEFSLGLFGPEQKIVPVLYLTEGSNNVPHQSGFYVMFFSFML